MAKISIDLHQGAIEIEGTEEFVRTAFSEVRDALGGLKLGASAAMPPTEADAAETLIPETGSGPTPNQASTKPKPKPKTAKPKGQPSSKSSTSGIGKYYKGTFDPNLDYSGLKDYCSKYNPSTNLNRNLVFAAFLRDKLGKSLCTADDIYSCYYFMKSDLSIPEAFGKSLNDSRSEGFISYTGPHDISIPTVGENKLTELAKAAVS